MRDAQQFWTAGHRSEALYLMGRAHVGHQREAECDAGMIDAEDRTAYKYRADKRWLKRNSLIESSL
jgi:hypothetical protein